MALTSSDFYRTCEFKSYFYSTSNFSLDVLEAKLL